MLTLEDAVGSKVGAIYTRLEARDLIDVDAIRQSCRFTDEQLLQMAQTRDDGFDRATCATRLRQVARIRDGRFADYGTTGEDLTALRSRILDWADTIATRPTDQRTPVTQARGGMVKLTMCRSVDRSLYPGRSTGCGRCP